jgi:RNA polymerase sigma factor (sigma-70 family)
MIDVADQPTDERLYRDLAPELIRFATALVGRAEAADVMASAFAKAMASRTWPAVVNRRAYLYRAVHNEARTHAKRSMRRTERERRVAEEDRWELPGLHPDVKAAVLQLSLRQRAVIVLTYWADFDPATTAEMLGISEGSVRQHLARARAHLREALDDHRP